MKASLRPFADRRAAGRQLAAAVARLDVRPPVVVLGLPRGGVPVAFEVAQALRAPLDAIPVRKVGVPGQPELALGAIASGAVTIRQPLPYMSVELGAQEFAELAALERRELERRELLYRAGRPPLELAGETAILVDDGLATGATMLAAVRAARKAGAAAVVAAAPVASREALALIEAECDETVVLMIPPSLYAVGEWYLDFAQIEDEEVCALLRHARGIPASGAGATVR
ncbi:MAG TPA: phosphoribosyltransferase family protein [Steroidobacteraceae bacterium]|nr:phosphoribosyltransferase family protein [Steroidobacteraceae bacterium]